MKTLGTFIKMVRKANDLTQEELATLFDVSQSVIVKYEKGISEPGIVYLRGFRKYFGIDLLEENITNVIPRKVYDKVTGESLFKKESGPTQRPDKNLLTQILDYHKNQSQAFEEFLSNLEKPKSILNELPDLSPDEIQALADFQGNDSKASSANQQGRKQGDSSQRKGS